MKTIKVLLGLIITLSFVACSTDDYQLVEELNEIEEQFEIQRKNHNQGYSDYIEEGMYGDDLENSNFVCKITISYNTYNLYERSPIRYAFFQEYDGLFLISKATESNPNEVWGYYFYYTDNDGRQHSRGTRPPITTTGPALNPGEYSRKEVLVDAIMAHPKLAFLAIDCNMPVNPEPNPEPTPLPIYNGGFELNVPIISNEQTSGSDNGTISDILLGW